jgi:hypothetical protein
MPYARGPGYSRGSGSRAGRNYCEVATERRYQRTMGTLVEILLDAYIGKRCSASKRDPVSYQLLAYHYRLVS